MVLGRAIKSYGIAWDKVKRAGPVAHSSPILARVVEANGKTALPLIHRQTAPIERQAHRAVLFPRKYRWIIWLESQLDSRMKLMP